MKKGLLLSLGFIFLATGCADFASLRRAPKGRSSSYGGSGGGGGNSWGGGGSGGGTGRYTGTPPHRYEIRGTGYVQVLQPVQTRSILKVQWAPRIQDRTIVGTNYTPNYSKLGVYIQVGQQDDPTPVLYNGYIQAAQRSEIMDYSSAFTPTCNPQDQYCLQTVEVKVHRPNADAHCIFLGMCPPFYPEWVQIHSTYPWTGYLYVETDLTNSLDYQP